MMHSASFNRRHSPNRRKTSVPAEVDMDGARFKAEIRDISFEGMRLSTPIEIDQGTPIAIQALGHTIPAIVHWYRDGEIGVHLLERLEGQTLIALENADDDLAEFR
ncbi:MAG: PilZ domain-containing protein [Paracoccaceae bacterium]|nr:PilZ domain-containing protein [Paracoccaceae bacterium]